MSVMQHFSKRLFELREEHNLSQTQLAKALGISRGSVSYYENGERTPDIEVLDKVSRYFDVSVEYLLGYINTRKEENRAIGNELGLSDEAIEVLKYYNKKEKRRKLIPVVNFMLEQETPEPEARISEEEMQIPLKEIAEMPKKEQHKYLEPIAKKINEIYKPWKDKHYVPLLSSIERFLGFKIDYKKMYSITTTDIKRAPDGKITADEFFEFMKDSVITTNNANIVDNVFAAEVQDILKKFKKKYQEEVQPCPEKE